MTQRHYKTHLLLHNRSIPIKKRVIRRQILTTCHLQESSFHTIKNIGLCKLPYYIPKKIAVPSPSQLPKHILKNIISKTVHQCLTFNGINLSETFLSGKSLRRTECFARQLCHYFGVTYQLGSLRSIGLMYGNKDHATVLHSYHVIQGFISVKEPSRYHLIMQAKKRLESILEEHMNESIKFDIDFEYPSEEISEKNLKYQRPAYLNN